MSTVWPRADADGVLPPGAVAVNTTLVPPRRSRPSLGVCVAPNAMARYNPVMTTRTTASARWGGEGVGGAEPVCLLTAGAEGVVDMGRASRGVRDVRGLPPAADRLGWAAGVRERQMRPQAQVC